MSSIQILEIALVSILALIFLFYSIVHGNMSIKYAIIWILFFSLVILTISAPIFIQKFVKFLGFQYLSNLFISLLLFTLVGMSMSLTISLSKLKEQNKILTQEIAILKNEIKDTK